MNSHAVSQQGYVDAFFEISKLLDIPALPISPKEAFETVMLPRLRELIEKDKCTHCGCAGK